MYVYSQEALCVRVYVCLLEGGWGEGSGDISKCKPNKENYLGDFNTLRSSGPK